MLDTLRRHSQSYLVYLFFGVIIVVFIFFFGPQSDGCAPSAISIVATADDREISSTQIEQLYARVEAFERGIPEEQRLGPGARKHQLAEDLVLQHLLAEEARAAGMQVSADQLTDYVMDSTRNPDYGTYADRLGEFDFDNYQLRVPGTFGMSLDEYERWKEDELLTRLLLETLGRAIVVSPDEVAAVHQLRNTQYELEFISLAPEQLEELFPVTDAAAQALAAAEPDRVRTYYETHRDEFESPRSLRVRRIFIRLPGESDPERRAEAQARYDEALAAVTENPDSFADVARELSESTDAAEGGDMGLKPLDDYLSFPFLEEQFEDLEVGEIATFSSEVSLIIFRIEEDNAAEIPPLEDVAEDVARTLLEGQRDASALRDLAAWFLAQAQAGSTLEEAAVEHARRQAATEPAAPGDNETDDDQTDDGEDTEEAQDEADDDPDPLVDVRTTGLFALDDPGMDLSQFGPQFAGQVSPPREPTRIPRIGDVPELAAVIASLTIDDAVAPAVYEEGENLVVARLVDYQPAPDPIDEETFATIHDAIWQEKTRLLLGDWELRLIFHRPLPLGTLLRERLNRALNDGDADFEEAYFVEPVPEPPPTG